MDKLPELHIRELNFSDFKLLRAFECANDGEPYSNRVQRNIQENLYREWQSPDEDLRVLLALDASRSTLTGLIVFQTRSVGDSFGVVRVLAVTHEWRRLGIATHLKEIALTEMSAAGCTSAISFVAVTNTAMRGVNRAWDAEEQVKDGEPDFIYTAIGLNPR